MRDLSDKANRTIFSLNSRYKLNKLPFNIAFKLFDTMIIPILLYGEHMNITLPKSPMNGESLR